MKKFILLFFMMSLVGCSQQPMQTNAPQMDMQTVAEYNQKVKSGNTVPMKKQHEQTEMQLNASDYRTKAEPRIQPNIILVPSLYYYRAF